MEVAPVQIKVSSKCLRSRRVYSSTLQHQHAKRRNWTPRTTQPATVACKNGSSVGICTHCIHVFVHLAPDLYAQSVLINKISAAGLSRKLIKSALLVG